MIGRVSPGAGHSSTWVPHQDWTPLGYTPWPGTLNLAHLSGVIPGAGVSIIERKTHWRTGAPLEVEARYVPGMIGGQVCHVRRYPDERVEVVAPVHLRSLLGLSDGDEVVVEWT